MLNNLYSKKHRNKYLALAFICGCLFVGDYLQVVSGSIHEADLSAMNVVYDMRVPALNTLFETVTYLGEWYTIVCICLLLLAFDKTRYHIGVPVALIAILSSAINFGFKNIVQRARPLEEMMLIEQHGFSFPSGHSVTGASVYILLAYLIVMTFRESSIMSGGNSDCRKVWEEDEGATNNRKSSGKICLAAVGLVLLALLIGISRVYLGVHYPSDVFGGFSEAGILICLMIAVFIPKWNRKADALRKKQQRVTEEELIENEVSQSENK